MRWWPSTSPFLTHHSTFYASPTPPPTLTAGAAILFHVHQTWWCYPQGLTSTALSPIPAFSRMGTILPLPCISLLTETPQQKQTLKLQTPPCLQQLWALREGGRRWRAVVEGWNNGAFRYSQNKKKKRPGINASRGNYFNAAVFTGRTWLSPQPNRRLRSVQFIRMGGKKLLRIIER